MRGQTRQPGDEVKRWTLIRQVESPHPGTHWLCQCRCGTVRIVAQHSLNRGRSSSCGCLLRELAAIRIAQMATTHGEARTGRKTAEYRAWRAMIGRCTDPNNIAYEQYAGRGITVCAAWLHDYPAFLAHLGRRTSPRHTVERINNNKGYEPGNVKWGTKTEQGRNTRANRHLTAQGITRLMCEWSEVTGIGVSTIAARLGRGWDEERAVLTPVRTQ